MLQGNLLCVCVQHINSAHIASSPHMVLHGLDLEAVFTLGQRCKVVVEPISTVTHHWY